MEQLRGSEPIAAQKAHEEHLGHVAAMGAQGTSDHLRWVSLEDAADLLDVPGSPKPQVDLRVDSFYNRIGKRVFDISVVIIGGLFALPVILLVALVIKLEGGPIFYSQQRIGRLGNVFRFWKFRTMVPGAKNQLEGYLRENPAAADEWRVVQKLTEDPRVTRVGRYLRKTSLDELPQLWNVLTGEMSLVGPRPMMPEQIAIYPGEDYFRLRPGITGYWQVADRNEVSFAARARFDSQYAREVSLRADLETLARTVVVVFKGTGN